MALTEEQRDVLRHPIRWFSKAEEDVIPRKELLGVLLATVGQSSMFGMAGANWFFHFCTNVLMLDPKIVGGMTGAMPVFDAVIDPVVGGVIDWHQFKDGRKLVPWIRNLAIPAAFMAFMLFVNWNISGTVYKVVYCVGIYLIWDTLYSFLNTSLLGLTAAISPHSKQRVRAVQWLDIGVLIGSFFPELLLPFLSGTGGNGSFGLNQQQIYLLFAAIMCGGGGLLFMTVTGTKERVTAMQGASRNPFVLIFNVLRHNHILLLFMVVDLVRAASPYVSEAYVYQQVTYNVGGKTIPASALMTIFMILAGLPGASLKLVAVKVIDRVGSMKRVLILAAITDVVTRVVACIIGISSIPRLVLVYVCETISNIPWGVYGIAQRAMISDSVDYVEWKTGQRTEGITMSARNLTGKLGAGLRRIVMGFCLDFIQYNPENVKLGIPQNAHCQKWAWPTYKLGTAFGALVSLIPLMMLNYPDSLKTQVESDLALRRAAAAQKVEMEVYTP
ncbi:MAG: MFS transporter [Oscillospiraceae bacterium]|nr:MFS transporter [Oscillospiraceae bacterium]